jgi:5-methylcytosine-specific restriction enzyme subunit McrC
MITDVTIAWPHRKLILDCKYYQEALVTRYDALRFRSGNLYQLHAYLTNKAIEPGWENAEGMLLYPSNGYRFDHTFTLHGRHRIRVSTIDLHQPWPEIEKELLELFHQLAPHVDRSK